MNFAEAAAYLSSLGYELSVKKFGLENTFRLLAGLGHPERDFLKVQVAGTNGKGSVCVFLDAIGTAAGLRTGLYTSPHLISVTERIRIGGREISEADFARHASVVRQTSEKLLEAGALVTLPTFFEQVTAIALNYFREQRVELAILETGLGGRFDSTTAARAEIVVLTPIDLDHQNILGSTLGEIAAEKAAIIRPDTKVFAAVQPPAAQAVIMEKADAVGVEPVWAGPDVKILDTSAADRPHLSLGTDRAVYKVRLRLRGRHQWGNATLAAHVAESLGEHGLSISAADIAGGLERAVHKGRLEFFRGILFDGAHNAAGAAALDAYLSEWVARPVTMIFGSMKDKDLSEIAPLLFQNADILILTEPDNPRSMAPAEISRFVPAEFDEKRLFLAGSVAEALATARRMSPAENLICVTGSLYLVGEAQKILKSRSEV